MRYDLVNIGTATLAPGTNVPLMQCSAGEETEKSEPYGNLANMCALGVTALPAPPDTDGKAEGIVLPEVGGLDGVIVGAHDPRAAGIVGQLSPGETALHATGKDFGSAVLAKEQAVSVMVKAKPGSSAKDIIQTWNLDAETVSTNAFGHLVEMSKDNGIVLCAEGGQAFISIKGDTIWICASKMLFGSNPTPATQIALGPGGLSTVGSTCMLGTP